MRGNDNDKQFVIDLCNKKSIVAGGGLTLNIKSIEYFMKVAEEMNVTRAAERLIISQQALSGCIKRLEDEYHVRLFDRKPTFRLTEAGKQMLFYGSQILEAESALRSAFSDITENAKTTLYFGISRLRSNAFFPAIWNRYKPSHPNISIELIDGNSNYLDGLLQDGKIDLYVGIDVPNSVNLTKTLLATERLHCCFSERLIESLYPGSYRDVLASFADGVDILRVIHMPMITLRSGNRLREALDRFFSRHKKPYYILECDEQGLIYDTSKSGLGIGLLSPITLYQHADEILSSREKIYTFPLSNNIDVNETYLVYRTDRKIPRYVRDFIECIEEVFRSYAESMTKNFSAR